MQSDDEHNGNGISKTHHRLCQWHIDANSSKHFGSLKSDKTFKYLWKKCMKFCETEEEFEATWKHMMDTYNIGNQKWFQKIYKLRHKWAFAFSKDTFTAGLSATSRSEGTNSTLKKQIGNITSSLHDCVIGYEEVQNNWREKEKRKDTHSSQNTPASLVPRNPLLKHAASVYTIKIFNLFQKEQVYTMGCELEDQFLYAGPSLRLFKVKSHGDSSRIRTVEFDTEKLEIKCSCHKFENFGILCSHVLKATKDNDQSNPFFARNPRIAKTVGATTTYIRHWDVKSKKGMEKGESSQRTAKGIKRKWQSSQTIETEFPSQEKSIHEVANTQPPNQLGADLHGQIQWHSQL
ncbi:hypothetical protein RD792_000541 [Penstemon davidsonii]|uniref:Protein FAR1-RELATED SEQUENCE n=1 Tax=Penstemon davidsonii TaxID=160366 RepID=A0ABR0DKX9_9LAMI|nr:hypothetical protein RD792_000541 [Penstemon davidsonii]